MNKSKLGLKTLLVIIGVVAAHDSFGQSVGAVSPPASAAALTQDKPSVDATQNDATQNKATSFGVVRESTSLPRRIFVRSHSLLVRGATVEEKLLKRREFQQLGFVITRNAAEADLILELRHDLFTKYVFSVVDAKTEIVLDGGKVRALGGTVADKVAKRFVKDMMKIGTP